MKYLIATILSMFLMASVAAAQDGYNVSPGDTLAIEVLEDPQLNRSILVLPDGTFNFPFAGTIQASGRSVDDIQQEIRDRIAGNFAAPPTVFVSVASVQPTAPTAPSGPAPTQTVEIYMLGEIGSPGPKAVMPGTTFLQAMSLSGGFSQFAATKRVQLRRNGANGQPQVYEINFRAISNGAKLRQDIVLMDGDVILVPERRLFE